MEETALAPTEQGTEGAETSDTLCPTDLLATWVTPAAT